MPPDTALDFGTEFARDVANGLVAPPKFLYPKYFYDPRGSELFEAITRQPEYYPTRTEAAILRGSSGDIAELIGDTVSLVELGSGSSVKTTILLESLLERSDEVHYMPIDIAPTILEETASRLDQRYPKLGVTPIVSQYETGLAKASTLVAEDESVPDRMLVLFLGSSVGNMEPEQAIEFLSSIRTQLEDQDALLVGFDLIKEESVLNAAYNDAAGVTAEFNLNLLARINRDLGGEFDLDRFSHRAFFNPEASRVEMHLVSGAAQDVTISNLQRAFHFEPNETIHTENSYKYTPESIEKHAEAAGFRVSELFTDERNWFALALFSPT
jgi:L-histidine N-alpha-methyltransferase